MGDAKFLANPVPIPVRGAEKKKWDILSRQNVPLAGQRPKGAPIRARARRPSPRRPPA